MALDIYINPQLGGYERINNKFTYVNTIINKVNFLLSTPLGSYIYAPEVGNNLLNKTGILSSSEIQEDITNCLQPLLNTNQLVNFTIQNYKLDTLTQRYQINLAITLPNADLEIITWMQ